MKATLGEAGTEQFTVETRVDGRTIKIQAIHDPFIHCRTVTVMSRWSHLKAIFSRQEAHVEVIVRGTEGAQRAIMTMDPIELRRESDAIVEERARVRARRYGDLSMDCCQAGGQVSASQPPSPVSPCGCAR